MEDRQNKKFATKDDLKAYVTKDYLRDELRYQKEDILTAMDRKFEKFKNEMLKAIAEMIHIGVDPITDDHEERIKKLEKHVFATT